jgi:hypothetical protein
MSCIFQPKEFTAVNLDSHTHTLDKLQNSTTTTWALLQGWMMYELYQPPYEGCNWPTGVKFKKSIL